MSDTNKEINEVTAAAEAATFGQRLARWIDDPFASIIVGIVTPVVASSVVLSGIWALGVVN
jgi:hypothetical protein